MIIGIAGKAGSGKDEFAKVAQEKFGAIVLPFAAALKTEVSEFLYSHGFPFEYNNLYGTQADKEKVCVIDAFTYEPYFMKFLYNFAELSDGRYYFTYRSLMQWFGSEYRRSQDENYWVNRLLDRVHSDPSKLYVVPDTRFANEAFAIRESNGCLIKVTRPSMVTISNMNHASENGLNDWTAWDYEINNDGTLEEYRQKCLEVLNKLVI